VVGMVGQRGGMLGGLGSGGGDTSQFSQFSSSDTSGTGFDIGSSLDGGGNFKNGGTTKKFKAHKMYGPKGEVKIAKTLKEHLALKKKGWGHNPPKAKGGDTMSQFGDVMNSDAVQNWGVPIVSDALEISDQVEAQKEALGSAKQARQVSDIALQASKTTPERINRSYWRPEDEVSTGEGKGPIYGVGTRVSKHGGTYKAQDGGMFNSEYMPLVNPNQQKSFGQGGYLKQAAQGFT